MTKIIMPSDFSQKMEKCVAMKSLQQIISYNEEVLIYDRL